VAVESVLPRTFPSHGPESSSPAGRATRRTVEGAVVRGCARAEAGRAPARVVVVHGRIGEAPPVGVTIVIVVVEIIVVVVTVSSVPLQLGVTERNPNRNPNERKKKRTEKCVRASLLFLYFAPVVLHLFLATMLCYSPTQHRNHKYS